MHYVSILIASDRVMCWLGHMIRARKRVVYIVIIVTGERDLFDSVRAVHASSRLSGRLHRGEQKRDQDSDDRYDHEKFDQSKAASAIIQKFGAESSLKSRRRRNS